MKSKRINKLKNCFIENRFEIFFCFVLILLSFLLRLAAIKNIGDLVYDELYSWYFASKNNVVDVISSLLKEDVHMPLYFIILHFWIKIFGDSSKSMHFCTLVTTIPLIPLSFFIMKKLFNKTAACYAAVLFTLNTFCIYFSVQIRFYGLVILFSLLCSFLFVKLLEKFDKKYIISFTVAHVLLVYTYSLAPVLSFFYAICAYFYLVTANKIYIGRYLAVLCINFLFCLPAILFSLNNFLILSQNPICHAKEFFNFSWWAIYDILENFFSSENYQLINRLKASYRNLFDNLHCVKYFTFVFIPILISVFGFLKAVFSKNYRFSFFLYPSLFTLIMCICLASKDIIYFQTKYLLFVFPVFICSVAFGLSLIKNKIIGIFLFLILICLNTAKIMSDKNNVFNMHIREMGNIEAVMNDVVKINHDDYILIPFFSAKLKMYIKNGKLIPFSMDEAIILKDKKSAKFYFGDELYDKINKNNVKELMKNYIFEEKIPDAFTKNLTSYTNLMKKGQKLILISPHFKISDFMDGKKRLNTQQYNQIPIFQLLMCKADNDARVILENNLKLVKKYSNNKRQYSVYVYLKD